MDKQPPITLHDALEGAGIEDALPVTLAGAELKGLAYDSRKVGPGTLFFGFPGAKTDGNKYANDAMARGALAVVSESPRPDHFNGVWLRARHARRALAVAARNFYRQPDQRLKLTAITGTNGKTTTSYLVESILAAAGFGGSLIGTIAYHVAGQVRAAVNTTPESLDILEILHETERSGGSHVTMEVSSHALALGRVYGIQFHTAVFTNLTRDHLDFHGTMEEYFRCKKMLFDGAGAAPPRYAVINAGDAASAQLEFGGETLTFGIDDNATLRASKISNSFSGLRFELQYNGERRWVESPLVGRFNVLNILAAYGVGLSYGIDPETLARGIANLRNVPGRFERVEAGQPFLVVVDYAHTDDALRNVIALGRALNPKRIITLFGCGGDRDRAKRPLMGMAAAEASDMAILTSDNPRGEDPLAIINDALVGLRRFDTPHIVEPDRKTAIERAVAEAQPGDVVIIAGKGHEDYQIFRDRTIHFDDRETARNALLALGYGGNAQ